MNNKQFQFYFLLTLILATSILTFFVFRYFLYTLVFAGVFMVLLKPLHVKILDLVGQRQSLASFITLLVVIFFIFTPLTFLGFQITKEARDLYLVVTSGDAKDAFLSAINNLLIYWQKNFPGSENFSVDFNAYIKQGLSWLIQNFSSIFSSLAKIVVNFLIFLVAFYFLLKDGNKLKKLIINISPLDNKDNEEILSKLGLAINSVIKGRLLIAITQGALAAIGFLIFGIPNAILWGSVTIIAALIPGIGTSLVVIPAVVFLLINGHVFSAIGFTVWGFLIIGLIDNILGPKLISRGVQIHPFLIFLSVLGGIIFYGPIGFLLGPLTLSMLLALLDIYFSLIKKTSS